MVTAKILFWIACFIVFYSYIGYGLLIWLLVKLKPGRKAKFSDDFEPEVTLVTALYNEEDIVLEKIKNTFTLDYPQNKLKIIFITDGSTDNTAGIIKTYPEIQLLDSPGRKGKVAAINRAVGYVTTPFIVFCDANTYLNRESIRKLVRHFKNEQVGAVAGEKKIAPTAEGQYAAGEGEGLYWKYESFLKRIDSEFNTVVGAAGELFAVRTELFESVDDNILLDDFMISMKICQKGYKVVYEPEAFATEAPSLNIRDEQKRKIRISAGGIQSVLLLKPLLNIFKYGKLSFQYISHRVLRWIVCPPLLPIILLLNIIIYFFTRENLYLLVLILQICFYSGAMAGWLFTLRNRKVKALYIPYYFVFMNIAMYLGFFRFLNNTQSVLWEKAARKAFK